MTLAPTFASHPCARRSDASQPTLDSLYRAHAPALRGFAGRRVGRHDAEDLVQDVYMRLLQHGAATALERPREYLYRMAANLAVDAARKSKVRSRYAEELCACAAETMCESGIESALELCQVRMFLDALSPMCREAFLLHRLGALTHVEIADRQGVSVRTIERRMANAQKQLDSRLGR